MIGKPGDTIAVDGDKVSIKRAGDAEFEVLERRKLPESCYDETGERLVPNCELWEETLGPQHPYLASKHWPRSSGWWKRLIPLAGDRR